MNPKRKAYRQQLKNIKTRKEYNEYINTLKLTDIEKEVCDYIYVNGYTYNQIADKIFVSERTVKRIALKILSKI